LDPNNATAHSSRGIINRQLGKFVESIADLDRSIAIAAKGSTFAERGKTYFAMGQIDKALADYDQALALERFNDDARAARGLALMYKGNTAEGLPDLNNVLERIRPIRQHFWAAGLR
jgi:Tfp pilus assembly protein PilF